MFIVYLRVKDKIVNLKVLLISWLTEVIILVKTQNLINESRRSFYFTCSVKKCNK